MRIPEKCTGRLEKTTVCVKLREATQKCENGLWTLSAPFTPGEFDCGGCTLPSGTVLSVKAKATSVYDNDFFGNEPDMKVTVDYEKPMLSSAKINGNNITLDVVDNHYVQAVKLYCLSNGNLVSANGNDFYTPVFGDGAGENASVDIPVSSFENTVRSSDDQKLYVCVIDYAFNESVFAIEDALTFTERRLITQRPVENTRRLPTDMLTILKSHTTGLLTQIAATASLFFFRIAVPKKV